MPFRRTDALLPLPPPPAYLHTLPDNNPRRQYFRASELVRNPNSDVILTGRPATDRRIWPHLHQIRIAFLDDKRKKTVSILVAIFMSVCNYYYTHPECDCKYRELDFHYERRIKNNQPLVSDAAWITFPLGHVASWIPLKNIRTVHMTRVWRQPDTVQATERRRTNEGYDMLVVTRVRHEDQLPAPAQGRLEAVQEIHAQQQRILRIRFHEDDDVQVFDHTEASNAIHKLVVEEPGPPETITADAIDQLLQERTERVQRAVNQHEPNAARQDDDSDEEEDDFRYEDDPWELGMWNARFHKLIKWFRTRDGLPFALPFLRECLDKNNLFGAVMQEEFGRLFGTLGCTPDGCSPARPEDNERKSELLDEVYKFIASQHHEPIPDRFQAQEKRVFLRDILRIKQVQNAYTACKFPWKKLTEAADETIRLISAAQEARDFDPNRYPREIFKKGMMLVDEVSELDSRDRTPWSGMGSSFGAYGLQDSSRAIQVIAAVQVGHSPFTLNNEQPKVGLLDMCRTLGVRAVTYSPLGRGLVKGAYKSPDDFEPGDIRLANFPNNLALVDTLRTVGETHSATPGQVALAWILAEGEELIVIPGTSSFRNLEENWGALKVRLTLEVALIRQKAGKSGADDVLRNTPERLALSFQGWPP
ncbi:hypothetical protein CALCODRAFT_508332 [Calocera cornea HHB12733]|uniref:NADP-dependent oxidoreductase domain-containing protein n=1 Tax=Calocera cornea HHB12733 TaxID=1353952 RepID=A0A165GKS3_9BASI|nr:hypothetical protein CALCODRAFT_508332 [Calocera cornea HHB12733]